MARASRSTSRASRPRRELNRLLYIDLKLTLGDNDLFKVTRTAELAGVERPLPVPQPASGRVHRHPAGGLKVRGLEKRHLFKRAFRALLPTEILGEAEARLRRANHRTG